VTISTLWNTITHRSVSIYQHFKGAWYLHLQCSPKTANSSEMSAPTNSYGVILQHIPRHKSSHHSCVNFRSLWGGGERLLLFECNRFRAIHREQAKAKSSALQLFFILKGKHWFYVENTYSIIGQTENCNPVHLWQQLIKISLFLNSFTLSGYNDSVCLLCGVCSKAHMIQYNTFK
jgi:hypothetical protein